MLSSLFSWLDVHPNVYWLILALPTGAFLWAVVTGFWSNRDNTQSRRSEWIFVALMCVFVFAWRWPFTLEAQEFNPDESQLIAGAITLAHDPVFWRSVDGTTSGPLNFYALVPLRLIGLPLDYFTARLAALALVCAALFASYRLFRTHAPAAAARLAVLPGVLFFATAYDNDFVHYSSEHVSLAVIAIAAFWLMRASRTVAEDQRALVIGAFVAGLLPWAKMQTAPLALVLAGVGLYRVFADSRRSSAEKWRSAGYGILALGAPSVIGVLVVLVTGQFEHFFQNYVLQNVVYAGGGTTLQATVQGLATGSERTAVYPVFLGTTLAVITLALAALAMTRQSPGWFAVSSALVAATAIVCVLAPKRPFTHYLLLSIVPVTWWSGACVSEVWANVRWRRTFGFALLGISAVLPVVVRAMRPVPESFGRLEASWRRPWSVTANVIRTYAKPGESLGVWGWRPNVYVETGLRQATRDPHTVWVITNSTRRPYYRNRYLDDLRRNQPMFFVDSVGPGAMVYQNRASEGHEIFPELAEYIQQNFFLLVDQGVDRIYVRKNQWSGPIGMLTPSRLQRFLNESQPPRDIDASDPESTSPPNLSGWDIDGHGSRSLLPPSSMTWSLSGSERGVVLPYGLHPRAYTEGNSDGADIIVELQRTNEPARLVFRRHLDPLNNRADRGTLTTRVMLPPFEPGTKLVVRTETGPSPNDTWDWVYLGLMKWIKSDGFIAGQFPGFRRLPDSIIANRSELLNSGRVHVLLLNGPAALTYVLDGNERKLDFAFGFEAKSPGEYRTEDDATYRVELHHGSDPVKICFERRLRPAHDLRDRERQWAKVSLPEVAAGDQLVIRIEEAATDSARRTYLTDFSLTAK